MPQQTTKKRLFSVLQYTSVTFLVPCAYLIDRIIENDSVQATITVELVPHVSSFYPNNQCKSHSIILADCSGISIYKTENRLQKDDFSAFFL